MDNNNSTVLSALAEIGRCSISGIAAHYAGTVVEIISIATLQKFEYVNWIKIPIAKVMHEVTETFVSASTNINMYKYGYSAWEAIQHITKPIWCTPIETIVAGLFSIAFENIVEKVFIITHDSNMIQHQGAIELFSHGNLLKAVASTVGSNVGIYFYNQLFGLIDPTIQENFEKHSDF